MVQNSRIKQEKPPLKERLRDRLLTRENLQGMVITAVVLVIYVVLSLFLFHLSK